MREVGARLLSDPSAVERTLRATAARLLMSAIASVEGATQPGVAHVAGVCKQTMSRWCSGEKSLPLHRVLALPVEVRRELVRLLADAEGLDVSARPAARDVSDDVRSLATLAKESGEAIAALGRAIADGRIGPDEAKEIERECDDLVRAAVDVRKRAQEALTARGENVRRNGATS